MLDIDHDLLLLVDAYRAWVLGALALLFYAVSCWLSYRAGWDARNRLSRRRQEREATMPSRAVTTFNTPPARPGPVGRASVPTFAISDKAADALPEDAPAAAWSTVAAEERPAAAARPCSVAEEIVRLFNEGGEGLRQFRTELLRVANSDEVRDDPDAKPLLEPSAAGSYMLIRTGDTATDYVVPKPRLVVSRDEFRYGAFASLFRTNKPRFDIVYRQIRLVTPARVQMRGGHWEVTTPGELVLAGEEQAV